jgi:DNA mismatch repair ATPase MutS
MHKFRTLLMQVRPLECVSLHAELSKDTAKVIKGIQFGPTLSYLTQSNLPNVTETKNMLNDYFSAEHDKWPQGLEILLEELSQSQDDIAIVSMGFAIKYLESLMLSNSTLPFGQFYPFKGSTAGAYLNTRDYMTLNGNALENLEIFLTSSHQSYDATTGVTTAQRSTTGSLMDFMDRTCTPFGQRLLRKWLGMPLTDHQLIEDRLKSVCDLLTHNSVVQRFKAKASNGRRQWKQSHDIERMLSKVYSYSVKAQVQLAYDDISWNQRLRDFRKVLILLD